ncbi:hypothetical protein [Nocardiopsis dassonvillei]|uniref:hypothetical protein n=1 Tax=Nocardiopsis dassonvillei TaxID=2014 RepID=UPI00366C2880
MTVHPALTAASLLVDQAATDADSDLNAAVDVAGALAWASLRANTTTAQVRAWLATDMSEPHGILVRHGTTGSYTSAKALAAYANLPERKRAAIIDRIGDALTDAEHSADEPVSYDYHADPRPQWNVRLGWPKDTITNDYIKADNEQRAIERAKWNWPTAQVLHVAHDAEYAEWIEHWDDYHSVFPDRSELE